MAHFEPRAHPKGWARSGMILLLGYGGGLRLERIGRLVWAVAGIFLLILISAEPGDASDFRYNSSTHSIEMKGIIRVGDDIKFQSLLRSYPETKNIMLLGSAGGEYISSLRISLEIKKRRLNTASTNYCHSACAYIWLAGATRKVIGGVNPEIHLPYVTKTRQALPNLTYSWLEALGLPGTFANAVVRSVGPDNRFVKLTPAFLTRFGASNARV